MFLTEVTQAVYQKSKKWLHSIIKLHNFDSKNPRKFYCLPRIDYSSPELIACIGYCDPINDTIR